MKGKNMKIIRQPIAVEDFHALCRSVGWKEVAPESYALAVSNSMACVHAVKDGKVAGAARLVGDRGMYAYVQDLVVDAQYRGQGIGTALMRELETIVTEMEGGRGKLTLIAAHDVCDFYERMGYEESKPESKVMAKTAL